MQIIVVGASGFLGSKLFIELSKRNSVLGTYLNSSNMKGMANTCRLDIRKKSSIGAVLKKWKPELVIDCSGMTQTDFCENAKKPAYATNVKGVENLCNQAHCKIVHFSTDYVFDGKKGMYSEADPPNPINFYGMTKLQAERMVLSIGPGNLVVRVSGLFGLSPINNKFINKLKVKDVYGCVDLFSSPTYLNDLCRNFAGLIEHTGLIHFGGPERSSRYEMLKIASELLGLKCNVVSTTSKEMNFAAPRPIDVSLTSRVFSPPKTSIRHALTEMRKEIVERIP